MQNLWVILRFVVPNLLGLRTDAHHVYLFVKRVHARLGRNRKEGLEFVLEWASPRTLRHLRRVLAGTYESDPDLRDALRSSVKRVSSLLHPDRIGTSGFNMNHTPGGVVGVVVSDDGRFTEAFDCTFFISEVGRGWVEDLLGSEQGMLPCDGLEMAALEHRDGVLKVFFKRVEYTGTGFKCFVDRGSLYHWVQEGRVIKEVPTSVSIKA